jgi:hypothetical protein
MSGSICTPTTPTRIAALKIRSMNIFMLLEALHNSGRQVGVDVGRRSVGNYANESATPALDAAADHPTLKAKEVVAIQRRIDAEIIKVSCVGSRIGKSGITRGVLRIRRVHMPGRDKRETFLCNGIP